MWFEVAKASVLILTLLGAWVSVQIAFRRMFPERVAAGDDPMSLRVGCHGCEREKSCEQGQSGC